MSNDRQVMAAWQAFVAGGAPVCEVRPIVAHSWQRCIDRVAVEKDRAPVSPNEAFERARRRFPLGHNALAPVLNEAHRFLSETGSIMLLADADALVLYAQGDTDTMGYAGEINLQPGGRWDEALIGTNAIGTALHTAAPVQIHSAEHFCWEIKKWTCAAAPVQHPLDGHTLGILDVSGPAETFHPQALAFAVAAARRIESELAQRLNDEHATLLRRYLGKRHQLSGDVALIDREGRLIYASDRIQRLLGPDDGVPMLTKIVDLEGVRPDRWAERLPEPLADAALEPVADGDSPMGAIVKLKGRGNPRTRARPTDAQAVHFADIFGDSVQMRRCLARAQKIAAADTPVLIEGETGVGKELFARAIHFDGIRPGPWVPVNAAALPRDLIASELFGYAPGAFTGAADKGRAGKFEQADGGTLCLDEIGEMPLDLQPTLLRVIEDGLVVPVGAAQPVSVSLRLISMTNRDLQAQAAAGAFRADLFYRISVARLRIPPLRERGDDAALLAESFVHGACRRRGETPVAIDTEVLDALVRYDWPGNVRQLRNVIETMLLLRDHDRLTVADLPPEITHGGQGAAAQATAPETAEPPEDLRAQERAAVSHALAAAGGNLADAARRLGIARSTLYRKLRAYDLDPNARGGGR